MPILHPEILALGLKSLSASHDRPAADMIWGRHWHSYTDPKNGQTVCVRITRESEGRGQFGRDEDHDLSIKTLRFSKFGDSAPGIFQHDLREAKKDASIHPGVQGKTLYWQIKSRYKNPDTGRSSRWDVYYVDPKDKKKGKIGVRVKSILTEDHDLSVAPLFGLDDDDLRRKIYDYESSEPKDKAVDPKRNARIHPQVQGKLFAFEFISEKRYPRSLLPCRWDIYFVEPNKWDKGLIAVAAIDGSESHNLLTPVLRASDRDGIQDEIYQYENSPQYDRSVLAAVEEPLPQQEVKPSPVFNFFKPAAKTERKDPPPSSVVTTTAKAQPTGSSSATNASSTSSAVRTSPTSLAQPTSSPISGFAVFMGIVFGAGAIGAVGYALFSRSRRKAKA